MSLYHIDRHQRQYNESTKIFQEYLFNDKNKNALNYLKNVREMSNDVIEKFKLGYCPNNIKDLPDSWKYLKDRIVFESDPKVLLDKLIKLIEKYKKESSAMSFRA